MKTIWRLLRLLVWRDAWPELEAIINQMYAFYILYAEQGYAAMAAEFDKWEE